MRIYFYLKSFKRNATFILAFISAFIELRNMQFIISICLLNAFSLGAVAQAVVHHLSVI